jgi:hypothetical protein
VGLIGKMRHAYLVVDLEDGTYFWCSPDDFEPVSGWYQTHDLVSLMKQNKCITWYAWQDFMSRRCFCSGRGD